MTFPGPVDLITLTMGQVFDAAGNPANLSATVEVILPTGLAHIIWSATGDQMNVDGMAPMTNPSGDLTRLTAQVPAVDQSGWETPGDGTNPSVPITWWYYKVSGLATWPNSGARAGFAVPIQPVLGVSPLDIDPFRQTDEGATIVPGFLGPTAYVSSVAGLSGAVTAAALAAALDVPTDTELAADIPDGTSAVGAALDAWADSRYQARLGPLLLSTPTTATLTAAMARLPAAGGFIDIDDTVVLDSTFDAGDQPFHLRGNGKAASSLTAIPGGSDQELIKMTAGQRQKISDVTIVNAFAGARTTYDIDIVNPWYATLEDVEMQLSSTATLMGGVIVRKDGTAEGSDRAFQPNFRNLFIRNGHLVIDGVTDGIIEGGYVWANGTNGVGAVEWRAGSGGWSVDKLSVVPTANGGHVVTGGITNLVINEGQFDGSYAGIQTGPAFKVLTTGYVRGLKITDVMAYSMWGMGLDLYNVHNADVRVILKDCNKGNTGDPWIRLRASKICDIDVKAMATVAPTTPGLLISGDDAGNDQNTYGGTVEAPDATFTSPYVTYTANDTVRGRGMVQI